ncbi:hypothetical protein EVAR_15901_1 [Eumeta japonica]|uniref:Uncharacterized protein n=1 Tax=Eumeta variegata TaxID=151549 RepID=A0A4C1UE36_EUMVA|nr:hypothetical protein EVAR_15901_1 [Eumeta japonica]
MRVSESKESGVYQLQQQRALAALPNNLVTLRGLLIRCTNLNSIGRVMRQREIKPVELLAGQRAPNNVRCRMSGRAVRV